MVELSHRDRTIKVKIVYYGPALGGKTTNLQVLHQSALAAHRGELVSINSAQDRTILFDLLPLKATGFRGFDLRLQLVAVPGQAMYAASRRLALKLADAVVFVANSASDRWEENTQSLREMTENLLQNQLDPSSLPLVLQYNKRDLPALTPLDVMERGLNARRVDAIPAVAVRGEGVLETLQAALMRTMRDLGTRYKILETPGQSLSDWTRDALLGMFGTLSLVAAAPEPVASQDPAAEAPARPAPAPAPPPPRREPAAAASAPASELPARRTVRVVIPDEGTPGRGPDARVAETMVESYAEASAQLSASMAELREERDQARRRLANLHQALDSAQDVLAGQPLEPTLTSVLGLLAQAAGGGRHASFLVPEGRSARTAALRGLEFDPLLRRAAGARQVIDRFLHEMEPRIHHAGDSLDLGEALEAAEPPLAAAVCVPLRTPNALQGLAMLYYPRDAALPTDDALRHLAVVSRALSSALELARALETVRSAERSLQLALSGTASVHGLEEVVGFLERLRDRLGALRRHPGAPPAFVAEFTELGAALGGALATGRSLLAFSRGEVRREVVDLGETARALGAPGLELTLSHGATLVSADPVLLRLALLTLIDHVRSGSPAAGASVALRSTAEGGRVQVSVTAVTAAGMRGTRFDLVRRIAELHGGSLLFEDGLPGQRYTLVLDPA